MIDFSKRFESALQSLADGVEVWLDHLTLAGVLRVSNFGNVRTVDRWVKRGLYATRFVKSIVMKPQPINSGYLTVVCLVSGKSKGFLIHRLVLETFFGPCPEGKQCRHLDGTKTNNRLDNLLWGTHAENKEDQIRHGTKPMGDKVYLAKLKNEDIPKIHAEYEAGALMREIAEKYGVSQAAIGHILEGLVYKSAQPTKLAKIRPRGSKGEKNGRARFLTYNGRTMIVIDWAKELDISDNSLRDRIKAWGLERALSTPRKKAKRK